MGKAQGTIYHMKNSAPAESMQPKTNDLILKHNLGKTKGYIPSVPKRQIRNKDKIIGSKQV